MAEERKIRVLHVIATGGTGGAEAMLYKLLSQMDRQSIRSAVIFLTCGGKLESQIQQLGIETFALRKKHGAFMPWDFVRLCKWIRRWRPDVIQTWMYHADLIGGLAARLADVRRVLWGVRSSDLRRKGIRWSTLLLCKAAAFVSKWMPFHIVYNSQCGRSWHEAQGYDTTKGILIGNGFDCALFQPNQNFRERFRSRYGLGNGELLVGMIARWHPMKDHLNFIEASSILNKLRPGTRFLLCGPGCGKENTALIAELQKRGLQSRYILMDESSECEKILAAVDLFSLTSNSESFPNVIGEAMACGVPCVATDVGDCALIIGDTGRIVPPRDPEALAKAWGELLKMDPEERRRLGLRARQRIMDHYSLDAVARKYEALFREGIV